MLQARCLDRDCCAARLHSSKPTNNPLAASTSVWLQTALLAALRLHTTIMAGMAGSLLPMLLAADAQLLNHHSRAFK
jgi:hypothetical protein